MKKLITAAVASSFAFLAMGLVNGDEIQLPSGTSLEGYIGTELKPAYDDIGDTTSNRKWLLVGDENAELLVTNYESGVTLPPRPEQFSGANEKFLKIDTTGRLYRSIGVNSQTVESFPTQAIGTDGIYLDTLVQFTAADDQFKADAITEGDKIAISYVERDADSVDEGETPYTNFVVRAAYVDAANSRIVATNYFLTFPGQSANEVQFDKTRWHRLTVRAISNVGNAYAPVGFVVYVDGTNLVYNASVSGGSVVAGDETYVGSLNSVVKTYLYNSEAHSLLPSLMTSDDIGYDALAAVAFNGNGCVDDISFTTEKPTMGEDPFLPVEGMTVTIAWDANVTNYTVVAGETILINEAASGAGSTNLLLAGEITAITVTAKYAKGYEAGAWSASAGTLNNGVWTFENGATLTINSMLPLFEVGGVHYGSFEAALAAAVAAGTSESPATIKLLANFEGTASEPALMFSTGYIVLDLNGKTIQGLDSDYSVANTGASLTIIDSASGGTIAVPQMSDPEQFAVGSLFVYGDTAITVIRAGIFEGVITVGTVTPELVSPTDVLTVYGGQFYDADYDETDEQSVFYLVAYAGEYNFLPEGVTYNYDGSNYFTVSASTPMPTQVAVPTALLGIVYDGTLKTGVVEQTGFTLTGNTAINAGTYEATATLAQGYIWSDSSTEAKSINWSIAAKTDATVYVTLSSYDAEYSAQLEFPTVMANVGNEAVFGTTAWDPASIVEPSAAGVTNDYTVTFTVTNGNYTGSTGTATFKVWKAAGGGYPSYIPEDATVKAKYDTWAETYGPDTGSTHETAFLLNIAPAASDQTLEPASVSLVDGKVVITANQDLKAVNGKVYIKTATTIAGLSSATWLEATVDGTTGEVKVTPGVSDTAGFYKIKVDF